VRTELIPLRVPQERCWDFDGTAELTIVRLTDAEGRSGIGEIKGSIGAASSFVESPSFLIWARGMVEIIAGADPVDRAALWDRLYKCTIYTARRGAGIAALSGIDIALHDLAGKQLNIPVYKLLGGARQPKVTPYATIFPGMPNGRSLGQLMNEIGSLFDRAKALGFKAVKMEVMFEDLADDDTLVSLITEGGQRLGKGTALAIDFAYRWRDWRSAARVLERIAQYDILFAEAALMHDDLLGHARLCPRSGIGGHQVGSAGVDRAWLRRRRAAGNHQGRRLHGMARIAEMCDLAGVQCIPHGWVGGIGSMCQLHLQAASPAMPYLEYLHPDLFPSAIRREVTKPEPTLHDGHYALPTAPGLGVELCEDALAQFRPAA
jgi:L-alanine-DL-glutamate epimerase-like enolase superfamily enzyme